MEEKLTVASCIITTPSRYDRAFEMAEMLNREGGMPVEISCLDEKPSKAGIVKNDRRAYEMLGGLYPGAVYNLLLADDLIPVDDFTEKAARRLEEANANRWDVVSFFAIHDAIPGWEDQRWYTRPGKQFLFEQALAMKAELAQEFAEWSWKRNAKRGADVILGEFFGERGLTVHYTLPHLVQHDIGLKSSVGNPWKVYGRERVSKMFDPNGE